jgi:hypothetical protein
MAAQSPDNFGPTVSPGCFDPIPPRSPLPKEGGKIIEGVFGRQSRPKTPVWRECNDNEHQLHIATLPHIRANAIGNVSYTLNHAYLFPKHFVYKHTVR